MMNSMKRFFTMMLTMAAIASCGQKNDGQQSEPIEKHEIAISDGHFTPEILHQLGKVSDPQVSPDGTRIVYGVAYTSIEENRSQRHLFIMDIDGGNNRQLTHEKSSVSNALWLDNEHIAYLQEGQIYILPLAGGKAVKASDLEGGINEFKISPDGKNILYSADFKIAKKAADIYPDVPKSTARTIETLMYRHWDHFVENIRHTYVAPFTGWKLGEGVDLLEGEEYELPTDPFSGLEQLDFSPDGKQIVYACRKVGRTEYAFSTNTDIYIYDIATRSHKNISEGMMGYDTDPVWSPDGNFIAWLSMERNGYEADKVRLMVADTKTFRHRDLTVDFIYDVEGPAWSEDSKALYFNSIVEGVGEIWKAPLEGTLSRITPKHEWYDFSGVTPVGERLIATNASMLRGPEIVSVSLKDGSWQQLSHENDNLIAALDEVGMEEHWITTTDGKKMLTWALFPPHFDKSKQYPAILFCNGGPQTPSSQSWSTRWNFRLMASQGYVVVIPNRRGNVGFGQEWKEQISGDYIGQNMRDYLSAADYFKAQPYVGKMGAVGASYGGYSIYYLAGIHNNRFSAFVAHAGIFDEESMYMNTEELWFGNWDNGGCEKPEFPLSGSPWSPTYAALRHYANSPHKLARNWNTPILVTHGELDYRVPVDQGMMAFNTAQMMGVPSKMILFPDENHWILKPQNSIHWNREFFGWLDTYCK